MSMPVLQCIGGFCATDDQLQSVEMDDRLTVPTGVSVQLDVRCNDDGECCLYNPHPLQSACVDL